MQLTPEIREKRMAVARDVQDQIRAGAYSLKPGNGYLVDKYDARQPWFLGLDGDLQSHADTVAEKCDMCQLGALLVSKARLFNHASVAYLIADLDDIPHSKVSQAKTRALLYDVFSKGVLETLESAFEVSGGSSFADELAWAAMQRRVEASAGAIYYHRHVQSQQFGYLASRQAPDASRMPEARAWACMNNLLANQGEFKPEQEPDLTGFPYDTAGQGRRGGANPRPEDLA